VDKRHLLIGALLCIATACGARVFLRAPPARAPDALMAACQGKMAYTTEVRINGAPAVLAVFSSTDGIATIAKRCRSVFGAACDLKTGERSASGIALRKDGVVRILALECEFSGRSGTIVFTLQQSETDYRSSLHAPDGSGPTAPAVFPGSRPTLCVADTRANLVMHLSSADAEAAAVASEMGGILVQQQWTPAVADDAGRSLPGGVRLYTRQDETVVLRVDAAPGGTGSAITLLHKGPGIE
jgi:hypothetical protein